MFGAKNDLHDYKKVSLDLFNGCEFSNLWSPLHSPPAKRVPPLMEDVHKSMKAA